ncbi:MAG: ADP-ribosylglycohydrolase family protein [Anaerolineales bacterium]
MEHEIRKTPLYHKALGCMLGGVIGDVLGTPTEGHDYQQIEESLGWVVDFQGEGTDDTVMKMLLAKALVQTDGYATLDDWARVWLSDWDCIFGSRRDKFFISVLHTAEKLRYHAVPRMAALGNMPSSSSAMCISPVGIVNACQPRQAARQAYDLASLIHQYDVGFCQDGAAAMAAAVAEAMCPDTTIASVLAAAQEAILPLSGQEMRDAIERVLQVARDTGEYGPFRETIYRHRDRYFYPLICDSRETIPLSLALLYLAEGDMERSVIYGANFGRDADTIASMCGAVSGALGGVSAIRTDWIQRITANASVDQEELAAKLSRVALIKSQRECEEHSLLKRLTG